MTPPAHIIPYSELMRCFYRRLYATYHIAEGTKIGWRPGPAGIEIWFPGEDEPLTADALAQPATPSTPPEKTIKLNTEEHRGRQG